MATRILRTLAMAALLVVSQGAPATNAGAAPPADEVVRQADGHRLVILGDLHGTREIPRLVGDVVERMSRAQPVLLALEVPEAEQESLEAALAAPDAARARTALLARAWWQRSDDQHDGRRSLDMLDLIERLRSLRHHGRAVSLMAYDVPADAVRPDPDWRDGVMAARIRQAYQAVPGRRVVMLTGNVHAMLRLPSYMQMPVPVRTAGMALRDLAPASIRIGAATGEGWGCVAGRCRAFPAAPAGRPREGEFTGAVTLPRLTIGRLITAPAR